MPIVHADIMTDNQNDPRGEPIALKRLKHTEAQPRNDRNILRQLYEEALIWRQLKHPNVLPLIGVETTIFENSDAPYCIVLPWMANGTIRNYMERLSQQQKPIPVGPWLLQIAHALDYLHRQRGVIHNDLRGANILIDHDCSVRLTDFGVSFLMKTRTSSTELRYPKGGSTRWSAPERLNKEVSRHGTLKGDHEGALVTALDIYSFACTCVELFEGNYPMYDADESANESTRNTKDHMMAIQYSICQGDHPCRPRGEGKEMSDELWELLKRCWAKDARERPVAEELVERLSTLIENGQLKSLSRPVSQGRFAQSQVTGSQ
ncbi:hypothetical protein EIP86_003558 [Pleurotus ostreatoroseus]|nr:hypothetical protein EIP86_003558 [Pleurotus ostreatoroseus]